jgi:spermidine synthase
VVALRELLVASFGSELVYLLGLAGLLLGTALGALLGPLARRSPGERVEGQVRAGLLLYALLLPAAVVVARALRRLLRGTPGAYLPLGAQLEGLALVLLPLGLLAGLLFQRAAAVALARGRTLAGAYAVESAGGFAGGALATLLLAAGFSNLRAGLLAALVALTAALLPRPRPRWLLVTAGPALLALGAALAFTPALDFALTRWHHPALVLTRDTPYGRVSVERMAGQLALFTNDVLTFESEGTAAEELAQVAALSVAAPRSLLLLGGGAEGFVAELLAHRPDRLVVVELDAALLAAVRELLPEEARAALTAPAVETVIADPRRFLARPGSYDLIVAALPEPDSGQTNRYYSREFFAACARRLAPGGVLAFRLRGGENLQTPLLAERNASVARALAAVFPYRLVLPGTSHLFLAAATPLPDDPARLAARLAVRGVEPRLVSAPYLDYLFQNDRRRQIAEQLAVSRAPENRDTRPVCYQLTLQLWLARLLPGRALRPPVPAGASPVGSLLAPWPLAAAVLLLATLLAARRREGARRALLAAAAGGLGMILEGALLLGYQAARGVLYQDLGLLLTAFMGGLAAGAAAADRRLAATPSRRAGAAVVLAAATVAGLTALVLTAGEGGLLPAFLLLLAAGGATGALFALATRTRDPERAIGPLYAADLLGGAAGSLLGSLWLLPLLGLPLSAGLAALVAFALLFLL